MCDSMGPYIGKKVLNRGRKTSIGKTTGISKKEIILLDQLENLAKTHPQVSQGLLIGGTAFRLYISEDMKKYISRDGRPTDLDFAFVSIPEEIKQYLFMERLIERAKVNYMLRTEEIEYSDFTVWHLDPKHTQKQKILGDVCFFEKNVGIIPIENEDLAQARILEIISGKNEVTQITVADPGLLLSTMINPQAITDTRTSRAILIIASANRNHELEPIAMRYASVLVRSNVSHDDIADIILRLNSRVRTGRSFERNSKKNIETFIRIATQSMSP